jgi:hypothetical protein
VHVLLDWRSFLLSDDTEEAAELAGERQDPERSETPAHGDALGSAPQPHDPFSDGGDVVIVVENEPCGGAGSRVGPT